MNPTACALPKGWLQALGPVTEASDYMAATHEAKATDTTDLQGHLELWLIALGWREWEGPNHQAHVQPQTLEWQQRVPPLHVSDPQTYP